MNSELSLLDTLLFKYQAVWLEYREMVDMQFPQTSEH